MKLEKILKRIYYFLCLHSKEIYFAAWVLVILVGVFTFWSIYNFLGEIQL